MRILVANRGEIAARLIRSIKKTGHSAIAIELFGVNSPAIKEADEVFFFKEEHVTLKDTFLSEKNIIDIARIARIEAIHPGYGFLSESPTFAEMTEKENIIFIGPSHQTLSTLSDKVKAKDLANSVGIPTIPSFNIQSISNLTAKDKKELSDRAKNIGYPLMVKAAFGGGGRGMREIISEETLIENIELASSEAERAFGNGSLFVEKLIKPAQHIEIQIVGDKLGNCIHLFERDCSLQRKHQKLIEFAPSINIEEATLKNLYRDSLKLARSAKLSNAATIEFLVNRETKEYFFIESNPRLQVEHTITEEITGLDIVELQINSALGKPLPRQEQIAKSGFAIQARVCAEIPERDFEPSTGKLEFLRFPDNLRIESGYDTNSEITTEYDSLIAKIIVHSPEIKSSKKKLLEGLDATAIKGISTNLPLLIRLISLESFMSKGLSVDFIESEYFSITPSEEQLEEIKSDAIKLISKLHLSEFKRCPNSDNPFNQIEKPLELSNQKVNLKIDQLDIDMLATILNSKNDINQNHSIVYLNIDRSKNFHVEFMLRGYLVQSSSLLELDEEKNSEKINSGEITAPLPCQILKVFIAENEEVEIGQKLVTFESMKTEYSINSPFSGVIKILGINPGDRLSKGDRILKLGTK